VWNERWKVRNVPKHAVLSVSVMDKDKGTPLNDFIGKVRLHRKRESVTDPLQFKTDINPGAKEV
jgi:hypothetical protein